MNIVIADLYEDGAEVVYIVVARWLMQHMKDNPKKSIRMCYRIRRMQDRVLDVEDNPIMRRRVKPEARYVTHVTCIFYRRRGNVVVRTSGSQSKETGFESSGYHFEALTISLIQCFHSSLNCRLSGYRQRQRWLSERKVFAL